mgnify:CR=1 FL=1
MPDHAPHPAAELEAQFRQLRALARAGISCDHHHLVVADRRQDVLPPLADRQVLRVADDRHGRGPVGHVRFERASDDRFFISIESRDPRFDAAATPRLLAEAGAARLEWLSA